MMNSIDKKSDMNPEQADFYQKLRQRIKVWIEKKSGKDNRMTEFVLLAPDLFHLLCRLMLDKEVPAAKKAKVAAVIIYFMTPMDLIPEAIFGPIGYLDDVALTALVLNDLINDLDPQIVTRNWAGDRDILNVVKTIIANSDKIVGRGLWNKLRNKIK
jgi:uncharacterized membrane protein YkvA (DUF1232 family)